MNKSGTSDAHEERMNNPCRPHFSFFKNYDSASERAFYRAGHR